MAIVLELAPEQESQLRTEASARGMTPAGYLKSLAGFSAETPEVAAWEAMLDGFDAGDEADHRETLTLLKRVVDEDRPGQRRIFGSGVNASEYQERKLCQESARSGTPTQAKHRKC